MRKKRFILFSYAANVYSAARGQDQKLSSLLLSSKLPEMTKTASSKRYLPFNVNMRSASSATQVSCEWHQQRRVWQHRTNLVISSSSSSSSWVVSGSRCAGGRHSRPNLLAHRPQHLYSLCLGNRSRTGSTPFGSTRLPSGDRRTDHQHAGCQETCMPSWRSPLPPGMQRVVIGGGYWMQMHDDDEQRIRSLWLRCMTLFDSRRLII